MKLKPLHDRVLIKRRSHAEKSAGGIIIPESAREKPLDATVVAVGSGKKLDDGTVRAMTVKAGDHVLIAKYAGTEVKLEGESMLIIREDEILGVID